jgi:hypothetical protein
MVSRKEYLRQYYLTHKEKTKEASRTWREENKDLAKEYRKRNNSLPRERFNKAKSNVKKRHRLWLLSKEEYSKLISQPCYYCDRDLSKETGSGLDRLDNNKEYEAGNVVPCCGSCNNSRNNNFTSEEWKVAMTAVLKFRKEKGA